MNIRQLMTIVIPIIFLVSIPAFASSTINKGELLTNEKKRILNKTSNRKNISQVTSITPQSTIIPKIVGGTDALAGAYPWMAVLLIASEPNASKAQLCGGSLIAEDIILTAAHCVAP
ncbi:MAG: trypsin-like serine protease, partial [Thiohalomonadales bacterium]